MPTFPAFGLRPYYTALRDWLYTSHNEDGTLNESAVTTALPSSVAVVNSPGAEGEALTVVSGLPDWAPVPSVAEVESLEDRADVLENERPRLPAYRYGVRAGTGTDQAANLHAAFAAAETLGGGYLIELPPGEITIDGTFSLSGYSSGMIGTGATTANTAYGAMEGTVLKCINQTGPVLDFTGFKAPLGMRGRVLFADFAIRGDGTAGTAKKGLYLYTGTNASSIDLSRITISETGGAPLHVKDFYLSEFSGITVFTPVDVVANDVPYVWLEGANGNRFYGLGIRSSVFDPALADTGASGAIRCDMGSGFQMHRAVFYGTWLENLRLSSNTAAIVTKTNATTWHGTQFFDCFKVAGATETAFAHFAAPTSQDYGGNQWVGMVEGKGSVADQIDYGIRLSQNGNHVQGPKGFGGNNVIIDAGVQWSYVALTGAESAQNNVGIIDNSGTTTNTLIDAPQGVWKIGARDLTASMSVGGLEFSNRFVDLGTPTGNIGLNMTTGANVFKFVLNANRAVTSITYPQAATGRRLTVMVKQDATGGRTLTWPVYVGFAGLTTPTLTTSPNRTDVFEFIYDSGVWREVSRTMGT